MKKLKISKSLSLPLDFVTSTAVILAQKGKGKTHTARALAEELLEAGQQVVALDPTDAWWGLRSSKDGKSEGYPIAIFGGDHGDIALEPGGGKLLAEAIVTERFSAVVSTENLSKGQELTFVADFMETLYRLNRQAMHLFIDEADIFAPQKPFGGEMRTCGAADDIVRRGRKKGIGCTLITQRSSVLNKNVLSQADMLIALGCSHPLDLDAIGDWVKRHADPKLARQMMESLPSLPRGEAWIWNPSAEIFKRVAIRDLTTFDSGATPKAGEKPKTAKRLAKVDIERLGASIAAQIERAKDADPTELRKKLAAATKEIERIKFRADNEIVIAKKPKTIEKFILKDAQIKRVEAVVAAGGKLASKIDELRATTSALGIEAALRDLATALKISMQPAILSTAPYATARDITPPPRQFLPKTITRATINSTSTRDVSDVSTNGKLPPGEAKIIDAAIQFGGIEKDRLRVLVGYKRSARDAYVSRAVKRGYLVIDGRGFLMPTPAGIAARPNIERLPTGHELQAYWYARLPIGEKTILEQLVEAYPNAVDRDDIAPDKYKRSARDAYVSRLAARGLVVNGRGSVTASEDLF